MIVYTMSSTFVRNVTLNERECGDDSDTLERIRSDDLLFLEHLVLTQRVQLGLLRSDLVGCRSVGIYTLVLVVSGSLDGSVRY